MKRFILTFFLLLSSFTWLFGQSSGDPSTIDVIPPSPTVANLMRFEEMPMDYYTGQAQVAIPLVSKSIHQGLGLNFSLNYNGSGVKVDSRSSWVGTSWSLSGTASISRTVRGLPDDFDDGSRLGILNIPKYWNHDNLSGEEKTRYAWEVADGKRDSEPDLFQYSFPGGSGRFIITLDGVKVLNPEQNVKIEVIYESGTSKKIDYFKIIDTQGYIYTFDVKESTFAQPVSGSITQADDSGGTISSSQAANNYTYVSAWHVSGITTSNQVILASFDYTASEESYVQSKSTSEYHIRSLPSSDMLLNSYNLSVMKPKRSVSYFLVTINTQKLSKISFHRDNTSLNFDLEDEHPETGGLYLKSLFLQDIHQDTIQFFTLDYEKAERLWLKEIHQHAFKQHSKSHTHFFNYYSPELLPNFGEEKDIWGYYSSLEKFVNNSVCGYVFDKDKIKIGLLESIIYPTGGKKVFDYENHTFSHGSGGELTEKMILRNPDNLIAQSQSLDYPNTVEGTGVFYNTMMNFTHDQFICVELSLNLTTIVEGVGVYQAEANNDSGDNPNEDWDTYNPLHSMRLVLKNDVNELKFWLDNQSQQRVYLKVPQGTSPFSNTEVYLESFMSGTYEITGSIQIHYSDKVLTPQEFLYGGGARIKSIAYYDDTLDTSSPQRQWHYEYQDRSNPLKSSGAVDGILGRLSKEYILNTRVHLFWEEINAPAPHFVPRSIQYLVRQQGMNLELTRGGYVGYKHVKVYETSNGWIDYEFTTAQDYPNPAGTFTHPFYPPRDLEYKRGLLISQTTYEENGRKLSSTQNIYDSYTNVLGIGLRNGKSENCEWIQFYSPTFFDGYINSNPDNAPMCFSGLTPCLDTYDNCLQYFYNVETGDNDMVVGGTSTGYYNLEYDIESAWSSLSSSKSWLYTYDEYGNVDSLLSKNQSIIYNLDNYQIKESHNYIEEGGEQYTYTQKMYYPVGGYPSTHYSSTEQDAIQKMETLNLVITPIYTESFKDDVLLSSQKTSFDEFHTDLVLPKSISVSLKDNPLEERINFIAYDNLGNLLSQSKTDDIPSSYLWGYDKTRPIAQLVGATYSEVEQAFGGTVPDFGANGFTGTQENDLRTWFASNKPEVQITTYTYDESRGGIVSSITSPNNQTITYEYDDFNRLSHIKDFEGNIIKTYTYHYKGE